MRVSIAVCVYTRGELVQAISPSEAKFSSEGLKAERKGQRVGRISGLVAYKDGFVVSTHAGALLIYRLDTGSGITATHPPISIYD